MKTSKSTLWLVWLIGCLISIISGATIVIVSQLGERYHTSILEQIRAGDPPVLTFIGLAIVFLPLVATLILVMKTGEDKG